jgi:energy-coupling factor transporter ATP-binding protein EcfA2
MKCISITFIFLILFTFSSSKPGYLFKSSERYFVVLAGPPGSGKTTLAKTFATDILKLSTCDTSEKNDQCFEPVMNLIDKYIEDNPDFPKLVNPIKRNLKAIELSKLEFPYTPSKDIRSILGQPKYDTLLNAFNGLVEHPYDMEYMCNYSTQTYFLIRNLNDYSNTNEKVLYDLIGDPEEKLIYFETLFANVKKGWFEDLFMMAHEKNFMTYIVYPYVQESTLTERIVNRAKSSGRLPCISELGFLTSTIQNNINMAITISLPDKFFMLDKVLIITDKQIKEYTKDQNDLVKCEFNKLELKDPTPTYTFIVHLLTLEQAYSFVGKVSVNTKEKTVTLISYNEKQDEITFIGPLFKNDGNDRLTIFIIENIQILRNYPVAAITFTGYIGTGAGSNTLYRLYIKTHNHKIVEEDFENLVLQLNENFNNKNRLRKS